MRARVPTGRPALTCMVQSMEKSMEKPTEKPKQSISSLWKPQAGAAEKPAEKAAEKPADKPVAAAGKAPEPKDDASRKRSSEAGGSSGQTLYKKRRTTAAENWEVLVTDKDAKIDFTPPAGATGAKVAIEWSFE